MNISDLPKTVARGKKRLGQGHGSGKAKTGGRGTKGQKSRGTIGPGFEGGQLPLIKRMPLLRGKGRNASQKKIVVTLRSEELNVLPAGTVVTLASLIKHGLVKTAAAAVKLVFGKEVTKAYKVKIFHSKGAKDAVEKAGGTVELE
ncbi:50S ribosomal protein L15 [Candidatus Gottesmanbacteria bacterium]|nr:50S ribosomal protein L15 [Candidatus Gottesmanbacteria bacterium]